MHKKFLSKTQNSVTREQMRLTLEIVCAILIMFGGLCAEPITAPTERRKEKNMIVREVATG